MQLLWYSIGLFIIKLCQFLYLWTFLLHTDTHTHTLTILVEADAKYEVSIHSNTTSIFVALFLLHRWCEWFFSPSWIWLRSTAPTFDNAWMYILSAEQLDCTFIGLENLSYLFTTFILIHSFFTFSLFSYEILRFSYTFTLLSIFISRFLCVCVVRFIIMFHFAAKNENPKQICARNGY